MKEKSITQAILVSHTHWDRAWYLTFEQYRYKLVRMIDRIIVMLNNDPEFKCFVLDGQTVLIEDYLEIRPENEKALKELISDQRLIIGPWYILPDLFLVSGESVIRNLQIGHQMASEFGGKLDVGYVPDPFGHFSQLPQILNGFDIDSFIFMRGMPPEVDKKKSLLFNWVAPDGSSVLAYNTKDGYLNSTNLGYEKEIGRYELVKPDINEAKKRVKNTVSNLSDFYPNELILLNNGIDHMPEQPEVPEIIHHLSTNGTDISITHGSFSDFMNQARKKGTNIQYSGDLLGNEDHPILLSVYSTRTYLKQQNHLAQYMLEKVAEPASIMKNELTGSDINKAILSHAWKTLLKNHPHDDICGCSADGVHDDNEIYFRHVKEHGENIFLDTLEEFTKIGFRHNFKLDSENRYLKVFAYNPHPFPQTTWISTSVVFSNLEREEDELLPAYDLTAYDSDGNELELEITATEAPFLKAEFVQFTWGRRYDIRIKTPLPSLGYQTILIEETKTPFQDEFCSVDLSRFENDYFILSHEKGALNLLEKKSAVSFKNFIQFEYTLDDGDTYSYSKASTEIYSTFKELKPGNHKDSIIATFSLQVPEALNSSNNVEIDIEVHLDFSGQEQVSLSIEYENKAKNGRLRILLPVGFKTDKTTADGHFALKTHQRTKELLPETSKEIYEPYPGELNYTTHFQGDFCLAEGDTFKTWVANRGLHEYELIEKDDADYFAITLHRAVGFLSVSNGKIRRPHAGPKIATPGAQCLRAMTFDLAWGVSGNEIFEITSLASAFSISPYSKELPVIIDAPKNGNLAGRKSFLSVKDHRIKLSAFKICEDSDDKIIRIYNISSKSLDSTMELGFDAKKYCTCNFLEEWDKSTETMLDDNILKFSAEPHQILTFRLRS